MRSIWVVVAAGVAMLGLTPAAHAAALPGPAPWQGPVEVAQERDAQFSSVGTALAADGRGVVVWASRAPRYAISAVDVAADGSLGAPVTLSAPGERASAPLVGMSADGETIVAWHVGPRSRGVSLCIRPASGGPCAVQRVSLPGRRAILQSLAVDVDGSAIVAWLQQTARGWRAAVAERAPGGAFGRARLVGPLGATAADVALGPASATLVFSRTPARRAGRRSASEIRAASWLRGEAPALTSVVSPRAHIATEPRVAVDDRDDAVVAWQSTHGVNEFGDRVRAHPRLRPGGLLERSGRARAVRAAAPPRAAGRPRRAAGEHGGPDGVGDGAAARDRLDPPRRRRALAEPDPCGAVVRRRARRARCGCPMARTAGFDPQVVARGERTVVVFREYGRPGVRDGLVVARVADGGSLAFAPLAGLSSPALIQQSVSRPRVALASSRRRACGVHRLRRRRLGRGRGRAGAAAGAGVGPVLARPVRYPHSARHQRGAPGAISALGARRRRLSDRAGA